MLAWRRAERPIISAKRDSITDATASESAIAENRPEKCLQSIGDQAVLLPPAAALLPPPQAQAGAQTELPTDLGQALFADHLGPNPGKFSFRKGGKAVKDICR